MREKKRRNLCIGFGDRPSKDHVESRSAGPLLGRSKKEGKTKENMVAGRGPSPKTEEKLLFPSTTCRESRVRKSREVTKGSVFQGGQERKAW